MDCLRGDGGRSLFLVRCNYTPSVETHRYVILLAPLNLPLPPFRAFISARSPRGCDGELQGRIMSDTALRYSPHLLTLIRGLTAPRTE